MKRAFLLIMLVLFSVSTFSQTKQKEKYYQEAFADLMDGKTRVLLNDRTRVDVLTDTHAIEVDFADEWAESIGQALHYEGMTGKQAGVLLVMKGYQGDESLDKLMGVAAKHGIDVWVWDYLDNTCKKVELKIEYRY